MTHLESTPLHSPNILELLSEIEQRDNDSSRDFTGTDPRGLTVLNTTGNDVGKVEDLYVDPNTRQPRYALLKLGNHPLGIHNRQVLVDFDDVAVEDDEHVRVKVSI